MSNRPALNMRRTLAGLAPADDVAVEALRKVAIGSPVGVTLRRARNVPQHRLYWQMCNLVAINHNQLKDPESVHQAIKLLVGWTDKVAIRATGEIIQVPRSISFGKMTQVEFEEYLRMAKDAVCEHLLPGVQLHELQDEILRIAT